MASSAATRGAWPAALQLAAMAANATTHGNGQQRYNLRCWVGNAATRSDGQQRAAALANAALQRFYFILFFF
jgi:hypothetical protein